MGRSFKNIPVRSSGEGVSKEKQCQVCGVSPTPKVVPESGETRKGGRNPYVSPGVMLQHSYNSAYAPVYPAYPSGLLILSRFTNARYARLDVPDWEFRARPGQSFRNDPSGAISRGRSCVRFKTRVGKNPGARLVEKFIIREPGGVQGFGFGQIGLASDRAKVVSGEKNRGARGSSCDAPADRPQIRSRAQQSETTYSKTAEVLKLGEPRRTPFARDAPHYHRQSRKLSRVHLDSQTDNPTEPLKYANPTSSHKEDQETLDSLSTTQNGLESRLDTKQLNFRSSPTDTKTKNRVDSDFSGEHQTPQSETAESINVSLSDAHDGPKLNDDCSSAEEHKTTDSSKSSEGVKKKLKLYAKSKKTDLLNKREDYVASDSSEVISIEIPKLPNFTAQAPEGVEKVKPLKVENKDSSRSSVVHVNGIGEAKLGDSELNAKCIEAKTKSRAGATNGCVISDEGDRDNKVQKADGEKASILAVKNKLDVSLSEQLGVVSAFNRVKEKDFKSQDNVDRVSEVHSAGFKSVCVVNQDSSDHTVATLSQESATLRNVDNKLLASSSTNEIHVNPAATVSGQRGVKQDTINEKSRTARPQKTNAGSELRFQNRSTTGGSEIKNTVEDVHGLKRTQNFERLDRDSLVGGPIGVSDDIKRGKSTSSDLINVCEAVSNGIDVNHNLVNGVVGEDKAECSKEKQSELAEGKGKAEKNFTPRADSFQNGSVGDQVRSEKIKPESRNDAADRAVSQDTKVKKKNIKKKSNKENCDNKVLSLHCLDDLNELFEEYKVFTEEQNLEVGWELLEVIVDMEGVKKKKKVIVKKKGSKVKVTPLEAKPPANPAETASPGDIMRQLSKKRVSLADEDLNLVGFNPDKRMSITDDVLVEEAALLDKMIKKELKEARKSSLAFPPISEENVDKEVEELAKKIAKTPTPKRVVPSPQERREMWKKNALRKSLKSLGGFFQKHHRPPTPSSSSESDECDVNCHQKCMLLMPNLCGVNQKLMVEALLNLKRGRRSASGPHSRPSLFKMDSESEGSQGDGRVTPPAPPAKTLPRFRTYTITDFQFLKVLGKGSFGKVLLAELKGSQCYYAVKCLKKDVVLEDDDVECTMIERKVLALGTGHPYFCHLFCTFQTESHLFFVMEYLNGGDLMFHIQQSGRFDEGRARFYAAEIVSALAFLHKLGIVYRDLKLDNVLLDFDGHVRIADFGMCKLQIYLDRTTDTFCGTPDYMAPEVIKGLRYNQCVDWWSFGILLYEMLVGQSPFSGCDEDHLFWSICNERPHMPRHLSPPAVAILKDLLEKDWTKRLGSSEFGSQDVMNHSFFDGMKWHLLDRRQIDPPYKPTTKHPLDTKYFDRAFTSEKPILTPVDKAILETMDQTQFEGFSYTNPNATE